jgi:hypothetical protein
MFTKIQKNNSFCWPIEQQYGKTAEMLDLLCAGVTAKTRARKIYRPIPNGVGARDFAQLEPSGVLVL